jgi:phage terminase large subunit-like protein
VPTRGHEVPLADVEAHVRELTKRFKVEAVIYDQTYFHHAAQRLDDEGVPMVVWSHRAMAQATGTLHEAVVHGRLRHGGDPVARAHALAAEIVEREHGAIITKRKTREPNDALVALAMAVQVAASEPQKRVPLVAFA